MNVLPDADQLSIQRAVAEFLQEECPPALVRSCEKEQAGYSRTLWQKFAELGWLTLCLPQEYGGQGLPLAYLGLVLEEAGRRIAPLPLLSTLLPSVLIAKYGDDEQRALLHRVGRGELILCYAVTEASGVWQVDQIECEARQEDDCLVLNGTKYFVDNFLDAAQCLVACRMVDGSGKSKLRAILVDTDAPGITIERLEPLAKDGECVVTLVDVRVPQANILGAPGRRGEVVAEMMDLAAALVVPLMQGAARQAMELAVAYVNQREAFGQPIGGFQAIQHMAADMLNAVDGTQLLSREAIWRIGAGLPAAVEISQAKAFANERCLMVCRAAQQMHGGLGFIEDCDINLWYRRVASWSLRAGTVYEHRERVAHALLDVPGKVRLDVPVLLPEQVQA
ncbi:MAG: acyl-CoA dehydrogenase family protein [Achromobacter veterisilvae]